MVNIVTISIIGGAGTGSAQTPLIRQFVDNKMATTYLANPSGTPPWLMKPLKGFGSPSATLGLGLGGAAVAYSAYGMSKGHRPAYVYGALSYAVPALVGGVLSGAFPTSQWEAAVAADPARPGSVRPIVGGAQVFHSFPAGRTVTVTPAGGSNISPATSNQLAAKTLF